MATEPQQSDSLRESMIAFPTQTREGAHTAVGRPPYGLQSPPSPCIVRLRPLPLPLLEDARAQERDRCCIHRT